MKVNPELKQELRNIKRLSKQAAAELDAAWIEELEEERRQVYDAILEDWQRQARQPAHIAKTLFKRLGAAL